jgi:hypothetical protein
VRITVDIDDKGAGRLLSVSEVLGLFTLPDGEGATVVTSGDTETTVPGNLVDQMREILANTETRSLAVGAKADGGAPIYFAGAEIGRLRVK